MPTIKRPKKADQIYQMKCTCGCKQVYVVLADAKGRDFACFTLDNDLWMPFAIDCIRIARGEDPVGPPNHASRLN